MSIVRWVVDAHGGKLRVSGNRGGGTVFEVSLPTSGRSLLGIYDHLDPRAAARTRAALDGK
ncbi:hypothetical protein [Actinoplanes sp. NBRC 103695]|uniref:hypothetical protein n=1 Tax=Actinoplanes sp. NBRC 103695 TaxID=3032202 RepID=UPI0024A1FF76|nr:hypothetical protein [Actinoplanes sp. NBRC 103695]GLY93238.1 hypothetical protein Acsp02_04940 [Actinoplanes sp. NBRC 103695]